MLDFDQLPRNPDGAILGAYRVSVPGLVLEGYEGPVEGYDVMRLHAIHGSALRIEADAPPRPTKRRKTRR